MFGAVAGDRYRDGWLPRSVLSVWISQLRNALLIHSASRVEVDGRRGLESRCGADLALAAVDFDAGVLQRFFDSLVFARGEPERQVVDFGAAVDRFAVVDFEKGETLAAALEKTLPVAFVVYFHAEKIDVELSCPRRVFGLENDVVDAGDVERGVDILPPESKIIAGHCELVRSP
jgi:hypothetical protein